jgi:predicted NAD/FAD-binding protein
MITPRHPSALPRVAVVGAGIAGLAAARALTARARVTLLEAQPRFGGHAHTVDVTLDGVRHGVDTGFLVFNHRTYPGLTALFRDLGVATAPADMSFSVKAPGAALEWSGRDARGVFCQPTNALRPRFWRMLADLVRFNRLATRIAQSGVDADLFQPLGAFLRTHRFSQEFRDWYLLPMTACIWSSPTRAMLDFPVGTLLRFCHNHGLLQVANRPQWYTVAGGSRHYVARIVQGLQDARAGVAVRAIRRDAGGVQVRTDHGTERFDHVVLATHAPQALALLEDASPLESTVLGSFRTQANRAVLHTDASVLPKSRAAWAAWNYEAAAGAGDPRVCVHYLINRLQPLPWRQPVIVSLNPLRAIDPRHVLGEFDYAHPLFDPAAIAAHANLPLLQGERRTWYCGAWTGYGFHEDGFASGEAVAQRLVTHQALVDVEYPREKVAA